MAITINSSVDSGFGYSLGKSSLKEVTISNFIKKISEKDAKILSQKIDSPSPDKLIIEYDNQYYVMGKLATKADPSLKRYSTNNRIGDIYHLIEILATLGLLCDTSKSFDTNLIVGLPNKLRDDKNDMADWLKKEWKFSYLTKNNKIDKIANVIQVAVIEQPIGAIYNLSQEEIDDVNIISCDIGHATADCCLMTNGVLSINNKDWIAIDGVKRCYIDLKDRLIDKFQKKYDIYDITESDLQVAIETGMFKLKKNNIDISEILNNILNDYAEYIVREIEDRYADYLSKADYVIGSGGIMNNRYFVQTLSDKLSKSKITFAMFDNPQKSIVNGMFNIANILFEDDFNTNENSNIISKEEVASDGEK
jgi:hypothetical protein